MTDPRGFEFIGIPSAEPGGGRRASGCPWRDTRSLLREAGLRPTRQRLSLGWLLFAKGDRHVTAEILFEEATRARVVVSLATVYNTLHQFTDAGLLREFAVDGSRTYFDTNVCDHHHFFVEGDETVMDIPGLGISVDDLPGVPPDMEVTRVDVVVRLRRKRDAASDAARSLGGERRLLERQFQPLPDIPQRLR